MQRKLFFWIAAVSAGALCGALLLVPTVVWRNLALSLVEWAVHRSAPVQELTGERLQERIGSQLNDYVLFDVRERAEYDVSHIAAARHIEPTMSAAEFMRLYGAELHGKDAVFYCSVGKRSSDAALRVEQVAKAAGARECYNLRGGIFRWHNLRRKVVDSVGRAQRVHPFDRFWGTVFLQQ
jgi:rhodanese-related sulfurtransferase